MDVADDAAAGAQHHRAVVGVRAAIEDRLDLVGNERPILARAGLDPDLRRMAHAHHLEILLAVENQLHRAAALQRKRHADRLHVRLGLVAEARADARREAPHARHRQLQALADACLHAEHRLVGRPEADAAVGVDLGKRTAGLERNVRLRRRLEPVLDDHVAFAPRRVEVAFGVERA